MCYSDSEEYPLDEYEYERLKRNSNEDLSITPFWMRCCEDNWDGSNDNCKCPPVGSKRYSSSSSSAKNDAFSRNVACHDLNGTTAPSTCITAAASAPPPQSTNANANANLSVSRQEGKSGVVGRVLFQRYFVGSRQNYQGSNQDQGTAVAASSPSSVVDSTNANAFSVSSALSLPDCKSSSSSRYQGKNTSSTSRRSTSKQKIYPNPEPRRDFVFDAAEVQDTASSAVMFSRSLLVGGC